VALRLAERVQLVFLLSCLLVGIPYFQAAIAHFISDGILRFFPAGRHFVSKTILTVLRCTIFLSLSCARDFVVIE